jgi:hypothetical protein
VHKDGAKGRNHLDERFNTILGEKNYIDKRSLAGEYSIADRTTTVIIINQKVQHSPSSFHRQIMKINPSQKN